MGMVIGGDKSKLRCKPKQPQINWDIQFPKEFFKSCILFTIYQAFSHAHYIYFKILTVALYGRDYHSHFIDGEIICPKSHNQQVIESGSKFRSPDCRVHVLGHQPTLEVATPGNTQEKLPSGSF
jgi:hypothetical protein